MIYFSTAQASPTDAQQAAPDTILVRKISWIGQKIDSAGSQTSGGE